jgi:hypothetical protein
MTQGILLFAHDNEQIQYSLLAAWQARRIHKWLGKPVSIVTDLASLDTLKQHNLDGLFDHIMLSDAETTQQKIYTDKLLTFKNVNRTHAYDLTPYDETIVLDADYVVNSRKLFFQATGKQYSNRIRTQYQNWLRDRYPNLQQQEV